MNKSISLKAIDSIPLHHLQDLNRVSGGLKTRFLDLIEKETNGIYISKEKATELLEALGEMCRARDIKDYEAYNKLYKALGGDNEN